jgi:hypothetical protein
MKKWFLILLVFGSVWLEGCDIHKRTEVENRKIAQVYFERYCRMIRYETNEFLGPALTISNVDTNNLSYSYKWTHKTDNVDILVVIDNSGEVAGGPGRLDYNIPPTPDRSRGKTAP